MPVTKYGPARNDADTAPAEEVVVEAADRDLAEPDVAAGNGIADGDIREGHSQELDDNAVVGIDGIPLAPAQYKKNHWMESERYWVNGRLELPRVRYIRKAFVRRMDQKLTIYRECVNTDRGSLLTRMINTCSWTDGIKV